MVPAAGIGMSPRLVEANHLVSERLAGTGILVIKRNAVDGYTYRPKRRGGMRGGHCRVHRYLECIVLRNYRVRVFVKGIAAEGSTTEVLIQSIGRRVINTFMIGCAGCFDGDIRAV